MSRRSKAKVCPTHGVKLTATMTRYGRRLGCPMNGCTVVCWDGPTSRPADAETRAARHRLHNLFDPLWQGRRVFQNRSAAYRWLAEVLTVKPKHCHFGMFSLEQCERAKEAIEKLSVAEMK